LQALRHGQTFLDPRLQARLQQQAAIALSGREQQVLVGLARGLTNKAIALESGIATTTVRDYISSMIRKLAVSNRTEVLSRAIALELLPQRRWAEPLDSAEAQILNSTGLGGESSQGDESAVGSDGDP
ncbi:MAG: response regulator transcription factor, partial [Cyanobium sp.]